MSESQVWDSKKKEEQEEEEEENEEESSMAVPAPLASIGGRKFFSFLHPPFTFYY